MDFAKPKNGTGSLSTLFYTSESGTRMVAIFRRHHVNEGRWNGLIQLGPGGIAKKGESPRAALWREIPEELPQLERFMDDGRLVIRGSDNDGILGIPSYVTSLPGRPGFNVHMFLIEIPAEAAVVLMDRVPGEVSLLAERGFGLLQNDRMDHDIVRKVVLSIDSLFALISLASSELSFPLFAPTNVLGAMVRSSPELFMPHYTLRCSSATVYEALIGLE